MLSTIWLVLKMAFTVILVELNWLVFCHQYRSRPACKSVQFDQALYCWQTIFKSSSWSSLKVIMESAKNGWWIIPFKKFNRLRVNVMGSPWPSLLKSLLLECKLDQSKFKTGQVHCIKKLNQVMLRKKK